MMIYFVLFLQVGSRSTLLTSGRVAGRFTRPSGLARRCARFGLVFINFQVRRLVQAGLALLVCANILSMGLRSDSERLDLDGHLLPHKLELIIVDLVVGILLISW